MSQPEKRPDYYTQMYRFKQAHEDPAHFIESLQDHHGYHHAEPIVVHPEGILHEVPTHHFPHTERVLEQPHVEFDHQAHSGPLGHPVTTVIPERHDDFGVAHGVAAVPVGGYHGAYEHTTVAHDLHRYAADAPHHVVTEAAHYYQN